MRKTLKLMARENVWITISLALLTLALWALLNRPEQEPPWPQRIQGFSFQPMRADHDPTLQIYPSAAQIDEDLAFLEGRSHAVRTYSVGATLAFVPTLAARHGINVAVGAWLDGSANDGPEMDQLLDLVPRQTNVVRVIVGNEAVLRGDLSVAEIVPHLERARAAFEVPVSTAEPWHVWLKNPELAAHVDYLAVHMLPYWENVSLDESIDYIVEKFEELEKAFPGKPIVITEVGWPSNGRTRRGAVASPSNEATFLRRFLSRAEREGYIYYLMEAFDQPWKAASEGSVGAYWGVWDVNRQAKFEFTAPIVEIPQWRVLAAVSVGVAIIALSLLLIDGAALRLRGRSFLAAIAFGAATTVVWIAYDTTQQYMTLGTAAVGALLLVGTALFFTLVLTEAHEWAEALWVRQRRRLSQLQPCMPGPLPRVSIHVPAHNEPPALVIETLDALAALAYPDFEVIVVDNNTRDPAVWKPVEAHCAKLGFRFFHVDPLEGYKAGALNFALRHTDPRAEVIGVIDADYAVSPSWLCELVPQFAERNVAIVQAPQDYRDDEQNAFKAMCYAEYSGFFHFGMQTRNERNAIIQHGTMTLVRRHVLEEVGGWAQWCITEDAELGLSIFADGYEAVYVPRSYGRGLMPDTFLDYKKQRSRWAYGAVRILRHHAAALLGLRRSKLSLGQRYHFIAGWMPWFADALNLLFVASAIAWSVAMIAAPYRIDPPRVVFSMLPVAIFAFRVAKTLYLYRTGPGATIRQTLSAALAGLALSHTIGLAVLGALGRSERPFFRTPKCAPTQRVRRALAAARGELCAMLLLWGTALGVALTPGPDSLELRLWIGMLAVLSVPYVAALVVSLLSAWPRLDARWIGRMRMVQAVELAPQDPLTATEPPRVQVRVS